MLKLLLTAGDLSITFSAVTGWSRQHRAERRNSRGDGEDARWRLERNQGCYTFTDCRCPESVAKGIEGGS